MVYIFGKTMGVNTFVGIVLVIFGCLHILLTYGAYIESHKKNRHVSGFPLVGAILILAGGLISGIKPLMILCLADPGLWGFIYSFVMEYSYNKRMYGYIEANGYSPDDRYDVDRKIKVDLDGQEMELSYMINNPYTLNNTRIMFAIIFDENGKRYVLLDRKKDGLDRILFSEDRIEIEDPVPGGRIKKLIIEILP